MQPAQRNSGRIEVQRSVSHSLSRRAVNAALSIMPSKLKAAHLARPVVPDVYWMLANSHQLTTNSPRLALPGLVAAYFSDGERPFHSGRGR